MLINPIAAGRILRDVVNYHDEVGLRFMDGVEARIAWSSQGPELKSIEQNIITDEVCMPKRFRYCIGKRIKSTMTEFSDRPDGRRLHIVFDDGHVMLLAWSRQPQVRQVDVRLQLEIPPMLGHAARMQ
jgi:hypothetical protein